MSDKLKKFVSEHRQEFDTKEPGNDLWKKIDAKIEVKNTSSISSKWLAKFTYLGFSASVLVIAIYFITRNLNHSPTKEIAINKSEPLQNSSEQLKALENKTIKKTNDLSVNKNDPNNYHDQPPLVISSTNSELHKQSIQNNKKDSAISSGSFASVIPDHKNSTNEKKENDLAINKKKTDIYIPAEPERMDSYTGTLYDHSSLCELLHIYKFPGKASLDKFAGTRSGSRKHRKTTVRTISCNHLENIENLKAIWIKGKTSKEITLSVGRNFKNILLVKKDGKELLPEAISHYYKGLGAISKYTGRSFEIVFKDKVDLLLFFKDVEAGDKISIDGIIEVVVKGKP